MLLFFLHGFLGGPEDWQPVIEHLPRHFICKTLDLNVENPLQHARRILRSEASSPFFLIGYSMGGRIAWRLSSAFSNLAGLVVLGAHPGLKTEEEKMARSTIDEEWIALLEKGDMMHFLTRWYAQPLFASLHEHPTLLQSLIAQRSKKDPRLLASMLRSSSLSLQPLLSLVCPTLFLYGEKDRKYADLYRPLPVVQAIRESGHAAHLENPLGVAYAITHFIEGESYDSSRI